MMVPTKKLLLKVVQERSQGVLDESPEENKDKNPFLPTARPCRRHPCGQGVC